MCQVAHSTALSASPCALTELSYWEQTQCQGVHGSSAAAGLFASLYISEGQRGLLGVARRCEACEPCGADKSRAEAASRGAFEVRPWVCRPVGGELQDAFERPLLPLSLMCDPRP